MTENFNESVNKGNAFGAVLSDLSKAFGCIDYIPLIAKPFAFGVPLLSLKLIYSYLSNRSDRILVIELILNLKCRRLHCTKNEIFH